VTDEHQSSDDDLSDRGCVVSDINRWAPGGSLSNIPITTPAPEATGESMSKIPITTPAPESAGGTVVDAATPRRGSRRSLIVIVALSAIVGVVLVITLGPWRDSPSTDGAKETATISIPVTSPAGTLATPEAVLPVADEDVVAESEVNDRRGCGRPDVWVQVCDAESFGGAAMGAVMHAVVAGGPGLVSVGIRGDQDCCFDDFLYSAERDPSYESDEYLVGDAGVWTSLDGLTRSRVPHDEAVFAVSNSSEEIMLSVTAAGPGLVAVGSSAASEYCGWDAAVWTSPDGLTWTQVQSPNTCGGPNGSSEQMHSVTDAGSALVAVGWEGSIGTFEDEERWAEDLGAAVWNS
jgi:hypothetical protein